MTVSYSITIDNDLDYMYDDWGNVISVYTRGSTVKTVIKDSDSGLTIIHEGGRIRFE